MKYVFTSKYLTRSRHLRMHARAAMSCPSVSLIYCFFLALSPFMSLFSPTLSSGFVLDLGYLTLNFHLYHTSIHLNNGIFGLTI